MVRAELPIHAIASAGRCVARQRKQKPANLSGNLLDMRLEGEVAGVVEVHFRGWKDNPCRDVSITDCEFYTGDDCVAGWHWDDVRAERCTLNSSCNGVRLFGPFANAGAEKSSLHSVEYFTPALVSEPLRFNVVAAAPLSDASGVVLPIVFASVRVPAPASPLNDCGPPCVPVKVTIRHGAASAVVAARAMAASYISISTYVKPRTPARLEPASRGGYC